MTTEHTTITPVGTVISYHGITAPTGYFACDGAEFDADVYPKLAAVLGKSSVPDLRGYFIRGYDTRNDVDTEGAGRELCSKQGDAIQNITGTFIGDLPKGPGASNHVSFDRSSGAFTSDTTVESLPWIQTNTNGSRIANVRAKLDASRVVPTALENRPKNKTLLFCIKHDEPETPAPQPVIPDLRLERETPWPMRYKGKQVYARLVDFGALPVAYGMKMFSHLIPGIEWCQVAWDYSIIRGGSATQSADAVTLGLVSTPPGALNMQWRVFMDKNAIHAHSLTNNANTAWNAEVCALYTKTTDEALP